MSQLAKDMNAMTPISEVFTEEMLSREPRPDAVRLILTADPGIVIMEDRDGKQHIGVDPAIIDGWFALEQGRRRAKEIIDEEMVFPPLPIGELHAANRDRRGTEDRRNSGDWRGAGLS